MTVTAAAGCGWTAVSNVAWITVNSGSNGSGNGSVGFTVAANTGASRNGTLTIAGKIFTVNQSADCTFTLDSTSSGAPAEGGTSSVNVTANSGCAWSATSNSTWITVVGGANGSGNGTVGYTVAPNTGAARTGTISIAGQTFTVNQTAAACSYTISPGAVSAPTGGMSSTVAVSANSGCGWTAASNAGWITINTGASGSGNGSVSYTVAANTGGPAKRHDDDRRPNIYSDSIRRMYLFSQSEFSQCPANRRAGFGRCFDTGRVFLDGDEQ